MIRANCLFSAVGWKEWGRKKDRKRLFPTTPPASSLKRGFARIISAFARLSSTMVLSMNYSTKNEFKTNYWGFMLIFVAKTQHFPLKLEDFSENSRIFAQNSRIFLQNSRFRKYQENPGLVSSIPKMYSNGKLLGSILSFDQF